MTLQASALVFVLLACGSTVQAQNTKGDKPASPSRETRFKTFKKKKSPARTASSRRVRTPNRSMASRATGSAPRRASGKERPGKPVRPISAPQPQTKQKAWTGDIAGYRLRHKNRSSAGDGKTNVYPQYSRYSRFPKATKPQSSERAVSNAGALKQLRRLESRGGPTPHNAPRVVPRTASRSFTARKSINVYANFAKPKHPRKQYNDTDLAGRPLRKKNFESPRLTVSGHRASRFYHGRPGGDRPSNAMGGGYRSATRATPKAWHGDIAGRGLRRRNFTSKKSVEGIPTRGSRPRSASKGHPGDVPLMGRRPGMGAWGVDALGGRGRRTSKGGGSKSGSWNNNGIAIQGRIPVQGADAAGFRGRIKGGKPATGGGSRSGSWNNNGIAIQGRMPVQGADAAGFRGRIKGGKPSTGGGSISGSWNNNEKPILGRMPKQGERAAQFGGDVKVRRPEKGMPDVANSMPRRGLSSQAKKVNGYPGKMKRFENQPGFGYQGEAHTGDVELKRFRKNFGQPDNASEASILKRRPKNTDAEQITARRKQPDYQRNKNAAEGALLKVAPSRSDMKAGELQVRIRQKEYGTKPHAAEGAMPGIKPSRSSVKASEYVGGIKRNWDYIHNPSSAQEALRTREPGRAFARSAAYQGNIKMQKFALFEKNRGLHPDTKFIKPNKNNVDSERDAVTNFKLWWARLFKKEETQPENVKYKGKKPRYDKGEQGLWYD